MHRSIQEITVGTKVKAWDVVMLEAVEAEVTEVFTKTVDSYYVINDSIEVTGMHPFYVVYPDDGADSPQHWDWVVVEDLKEGDNLMNNTGDLVPVTSIKKVDEELEVYNLTVEDYNNYFAGGVLVHNKWGDYHGKDKDPKTSRGELNAKANTFNTTVWDSARTALEAQVTELQAHKLAVGSAEGLINEDGTVNASGALDGDIPDGAYGDMVNKIRESERTRLDTLSTNQLDSENATRALQKDIRGEKTTELTTIGSAYVDQQKNINQAMELSGMVDVGARVEMDNQVTATAGQNAVQRKATQDLGEGQEDISIEKLQADAQAETDKANAIVAAQDALKKAEADSLAQTIQAVKAPMDTHTGVVRPENKAVEGQWDAARTRMNGDENKNFSSTVDHDSGTYTVETGYPTGLADGYSTSNSPQGYAMSLDLKKGDDVTKAFDWLNNKSGSGITGFAPADATTVADMWGGAANPDQTFIQTIGGKGQPGTAAANTKNNDDHFVHEACFAGDTLIEVIE